MLSLFGVQFSPEDLWELCVTVGVITEEEAQRGNALIFTYHSIASSWHPRATLKMHHISKRNRDMTVFVSAVVLTETELKAPPESSLPNDNREVIEHVIDSLTDDEDDEEEDEDATTELREQIAYRHFIIPSSAFTLDRFARWVVHHRDMADFPPQDRYTHTGQAESLVSRLWQVFVGILISVVRSVDGHHEAILFLQTNAWSRTFISTCTQCGKSCISSRDRHWMLS